LVARRGEPPRRADGDVAFAADVGAFRRSVAAGGAPPGMARRKASTTHEPAPGRHASPLRSGELARRCAPAAVFLVLTFLRP